MVKFEAGETITISKPYVHLLVDDLRGVKCDYCFKKPYRLKKCSQCCFVYYCNKNCQVQGWITHKTECKLLLKKTSKPNVYVRLISLIILKLKKFGKDEPFEEVHGRKVTFGTLMSHAQEIKQNATAYHKVLHTMDRVKDFIGEENVPPLEDFIEIYGKVAVNDFGIWKDTEMRKVGIGLYLGASVFDHSCEPNAVHVANGINIMIRAKKPIRRRDINKVRITYVDVLQLTKDRQEALMSKYYFRCECCRCTSMDLEKMMTKTLFDCPDAGDPMEEISRYMKLLETLKNNEGLTSPIYLLALEELLADTRSGYFADTHICMVKVLEKAYEAYLVTHQSKKALDVGLQLLKPYRLFYGPWSPILGIHLYEMASSLSFEGQTAASLPYLVEARKILKVTHGEEHPLFQKLFNTDNNNTYI